MAENFPTLAKEMDIKIQKPKRQRKKKEYKKFHTETYYNKISKVTKRFLKVAREKGLVTYKGIPIRLSSDFSTQTLHVRREQDDIFKVQNGEKNAIQESYPRQKFSLKNKRKIKIFPNKKQGNSSPLNLPYKMLKAVFSVEMNSCLNSSTIA